MHLFNAPFLRARPLFRVVSDRRVRFHIVNRLVRTRIMFQTFQPKTNYFF